jgi:DNA-binding transcriptional LysR family regulator
MPRRAAAAETANTLDVRRLRHLQAAVNEGSLSAAAVRLGLSQPALSTSIKSLESDLGVALLERHRFGVQATAYAEALLEHSKRIEAELDSAWSRVRRLRQRDVTSLRIGCGPSEATRLLPTALQHLHETRPELRVFVEYGLNEKLMPMVRLGEVEAALSSVPRSAAHPELRHETLHTDRAVVIARPEHPLAGRRSVPPAELARHAWVLARRWELERKAFDELFAEAGVEPPQAEVETSSAILMKSLVIHGDFLSFVPREMVHWEERTGLLRPLRVTGRSWERHVGLTTRRDNVAGDALQALQASLRFAVSQLSAR